METVLGNSLSPHGVQKEQLARGSPKCPFYSSLTCFPENLDRPNYFNCLGSGLLHIHCRDETSQIINCCPATLVFLSYYFKFSDGGKEINPGSHAYNGEVQRYSKADVLTVHTSTQWQIPK